MVREAAGQPVATVSALQELLRPKTAGDPVQLVVVRRKKTVTVTATLAAVSRPLTAGRRAILGIQVEPVAGKGVRIRAIASGSPAAAARLKVDDVIAKVDGTPVAAA